MLHYNEMVMQPPWFCMHPREEPTPFWNGLTNNLAPLLAQCTPSLSQEQFFGHDPLPDSMLPGGHNMPHTQCVLAVNLLGWLTGSTQHAARFKAKRHKGRNGNDLPPHHKSWAYIKVKAMSWGWHNHFEIYLHRLICFMYRGPPPSPAHVAGHLCHHKACLCPWHLEWMTQSANVQMGKDHRRHADYAPPVPKRTCRR